MKQFLLLSLMFLFVSGSSLFAQEPDPKSPAQQATRSTAFLAKTLNLDQDQTQAVLCAQQDFFIYQKRLFRQHAMSGGPSDGARLQLLHKRQDCQKKIFDVLTPAQAEAYHRHLDALKPR
jgi:hypothetical protein